MANNFTLTIIKPCAVKKGKTGEILSCIQKKGFKIGALKYTQLSLKQAQSFYHMHKEKPFFNGLTRFIASGPIVAAILYKANAVQAYREAIGVTDPLKAKKNTIRRLYGSSLRKNAVHGADSDKRASIESNFFFTKKERFKPF